MEIEQRTKALLARPSVSAAIAALAAQLETGKEIAGADAEELAGRYLETGDFVGSDYFG